MAQATLKGLKVAILVTDGFEKVELTEPRKTLDEAGAETRIVSPKADHVRTDSNIARFWRWDEVPATFATQSALSGGCRNVTIWSL